MNSSGNFYFNLSNNDMNKTGHYDVNEVSDGFYDSIEDAFFTFNKYVKGVFYPVTMVIGVIGNALIITVIVKVKDMLNSTNIFLANLAIADIMVLLDMGLKEIESIYNVKLRPFCDEFWRFWYFTEETVINASVLTVLAIGYERYYAICQPLKTRHICTKKRAFRISILTWIIAALSCSPQLFAKYWDIRWHVLYLFINAAVFFFFPPIVLSVLFLLMVQRLIMASAQSVNTATMKHRKQVVTMLATVFICFFLLQIPCRVYRFCFQLWLMDQDPHKPFIIYYINVSVTFEMLLYLHSAVNPILYNLMSTRFREAFKSILCQCAPRCFKSQIQRENNDI